jgi:hypothetical protein
VGSLDSQTVLAQAGEILEGGPDAFRRRRYGTISGVVRFQRVRGQAVPEGDDRQGWVQLLSATEFLVEGVQEAADDTLWRTR